MRPLKLAMINKRNPKNNESMLSLRHLNAANSVKNAWLPLKSPETETQNF